MRGRLALDLETRAGSPAKGDERGKSATEYRFRPRFVNQGFVRLKYLMARK